MLRKLIGAGDQITGFTLPFVVVVIILNRIYPELFRMGAGRSGIILGCIFLLIGIPIWFTSAVQVATHVPRNELITKGPFAIMLHPLYTSVALLVLPGIGFILDTWICLVIGIILYIASRLFSPKEDKKLDEMFSDEYRSYRSKVLLPWL